MVAMVDALHSGYMKLLRGLLGNKSIIKGGLSVVIKNVICLELTKRKQTVSD